MSEICGSTPAPEKAMLGRTLIAAPPERIWQALTDPAQLAQWWCEAEVDLSAGVYALRGPSLPGSPAEPVTTLLEHDAPRLLRFSWPMFDVETQFSFELEAQDGGTLVTTRQVGLRHSDLHVVLLENLRLHALGQGARRYDFSGETFGDIYLEMDYALPREQVHGALLDPAVLDRFWATGASIDPRVGGDYDYGWGDGAKRILDLKPAEKLSITWFETDDQPDTIVTWTLAGSDGGTRVTLAHTGFVPGTETNGLDIGWFGFLLALKGTLELGDRWQQVKVEGYTVEPVTT
jgi:uncharacterized protein YndB with AHSA1/START domain